jgi:hypothetical protein
MDRKLNTQRYLYNVCISSMRRDGERVDGGDVENLACLIAEGVDITTPDREAHCWVDMVDTAVEVLDEVAGIREGCHLPQVGHTYTAVVKAALDRLLEVA